MRKGNWVKLALDGGGYKCIDFLRYKALFKMLCSVLSVYQIILNSAVKLWVDNSWGRDWIIGRHENDGGGNCGMSLQLIPAGFISLLIIFCKFKILLHSDYQKKKNLTAQGFNNAPVLASAQATFPYIFPVSKFLPPGTFDIV